eukprot:scaffold5302_cov156-Amphora_coffeaeformis.AAC.3
MMRMGHSTSKICWPKATHRGKICCWLITVSAVEGAARGARLLGAVPPRLLPFESLSPIVDSGTGELGFGVPAASFGLRGTRAPNCLFECFVSHTLDFVPYDTRARSDAPDRHCVSARSSFCVDNALASQRLA